MKRIGCLVPYTNYTIEQEIQYLFESGFLSTKDICFHFARLMTKIRYSTNEYEYLSQLNKSTKETLEQLKPLQLDACAVFCTSAGLMGKKKFDQTITAIDSLQNACKYVDMRKCMLITPYTQEIGNSMVELILKNGIEIPFSKHLNLRHSEDYVNYGYNKLYDCILENYERGYGDIVISCTNLPTFHLIEKLESDLGITVITSNQSVLWAMLSELYIKHATYGVGSLLKRNL